MASFWSLRNAKTWHMLLMALTVTSLVAACAEDPFPRGGRHASTGEWPKENSGCRAHAKQKTEQEYALLQSTGPGIDYSRTSGYARQIDRYDAGRRERELFNTCVKQQQRYQIEDAEPTKTEQE